MRILKTKWFATWARKEAISNTALLNAIEEIEAGLIDADLGGGLIKKRIARKGSGKSSGYRVVIAYRTRERSVFIFGFAKSQRKSLFGKELTDFKAYARDVLGCSDEKIEDLIIMEKLIEVD